MSSEKNESAQKFWDNEQGFRVQRKIVQIRDEQLFKDIDAAITEEKAKGSKYRSFQRIVIALVTQWLRDREQGKLRTEHPRLNRLLELIEGYDEPADVDRILGFLVSAVEMDQDGMAQSSRNRGGGAQSAPKRKSAY